MHKCSKIVHWHILFNIIISLNCVLLESRVWWSLILWKAIECISVHVKWICMFKSKNVIWFRHCVTLKLFFALSLVVKLWVFCFGLLQKRLRKYFLTTRNADTSTKQKPYFQLCPPLLMGIFFYYYEIHNSLTFVLFYSWRIHYNRKFYINTFIKTTFLIHHV